QVRRSRGVEAVAVILESLARVIRKSFATEPALTAGDVRTRDNPVTRSQRRSVRGKDVAAGVHDDADVLVATDERILEPALVWRSCVLDRFAAESVLVGSADPGEEDVHQHGAALDLQTRELLDLAEDEARHHGHPHGRPRAR